jgi:hypothetical protein
MIFHSLGSDTARAQGAFGDLGCPAGSVLAQPPQLGGDDWDAFVSDTASGYVRFEKLENVGGPICVLRWWGFTAQDSGEGFAECAESPMVFRIGCLPSY